MRPLRPWPSTEPAVGAARSGVCRDAAAIYHLERAEADAIIEHQVTTISERRAEAADTARLTAAERSFLWQRQILNPSIHEPD